jgi:hypothetical protein
MAESEPLDLMTAATFREARLLLDEAAVPEMTWADAVADACPNLTALYDAVHAGVAKGWR